MVESDKEPHDAESPEDVQIIIKTDKHSKQRQVKHEVYDTGTTPEQFNAGDQGPHSAQYGRENGEDPQELERERKPTRKPTDDEFDEGNQPPKQQPSSGIAWLS